ncbi:MAG: transposase [Arenicella sp.]
MNQTIKPPSFRLPLEADDIQVNTCTNPYCNSFGKKPINGNKIEKLERDKHFVIVGINGVNKKGEVIKSRGVKCKNCGVISSVHSNYACAEELKRFLSSRAKAISCRNKDCENNGVLLQANSSQYRKFGKSQSGSIRYRCKSCLSTFSISSNSNHRLRKPEKTIEILKLLVNKVPMRRICEVADVSPSLVYQRIDRIYDVFSKYSEHEKSIFSNLGAEFLHLCSDSQDITLNWDTSLDRRITVLKSFATAEAKSGFIVAQHVNFDPNIDPIELELEARELGDPELQLSYRRYARIWMPSDFRGESEGTEENKISKVFANGAMVRQIYTQYGHFLYLQKILNSIPELQFSLDPDPGIGRAVLYSFREKVIKNTLQVCLVKIQKDLTLSEKKTLLANSDEFWEEEQRKQPSLSEVQLLEHIIERQLLEESYQSLKPSKRWIDSPLPNINEPYKQIQLISYDDEGQSKKALWAIARASLRSVDRYFMLVRRRLSLFERPIHSSSSTNRAWHGYQAYNPYTTVKLLEIFRIVYNYHLAGTTKQTPAQKLGITDRPLSLDELIKGVTL